MSKDHDTHVLMRTSPKGHAFIGRCIRCGQTGLRGDQMWEACPNPGGMTQGEAVVAAILGDEV